MSSRLSLLAATALVVTAGLSAGAHAIPAVGLVAGTSLFTFDTATPGTATNPVTITGLVTGDQLLGIDYRPATGVLYGLGNTGALYTLSAGTGVAIYAAQLSISLAAGDVDISFNPTVDRLRIVGTSGQNLRVNVDSGAVTVDGTLAYAAGDPNAGTPPRIVGAAYTNQVAGATTTTLYDLDASNASLTTQSPPNNGTQNTIGPLGVRGIVSFDIDPAGNAFAASSSTLYSVNLITGAATGIGAFGNASVTDFALTPTAVPEPLSLVLLGTGLVGLAMTRRNRTTAATV